MQSVKLGKREVMSPQRGSRRKSKEGKIEMEGTVVEALPDTMFRVKLYNEYGVWPIYRARCGLSITIRSVNQLAPVKAICQVSSLMNRGRLMRCPALQTGSSHILVKS